jgi:hypothetical protein
VGYRVVGFGQVKEDDECFLFLSFVSVDVV